MFIVKAALAAVLFYRAHVRSSEYIKESIEKRRLMQAIRHSFELREMDEGDFFVKDNQYFLISALRTSLLLPNDTKILFDNVDIGEIAFAHIQKLYDAGNRASKTNLG